MSSIAFIPRSLRYGIFSLSPANVPGAATFDEGSFVKPLTCVSYITRSSIGFSSCFTSPQLKLLFTTRALYTKLSEPSGLSPQFLCPVTAFAYGSRITLSLLNKSPFAGSYSPSNENAYSKSVIFISKTSIE